MCCVACAGVASCDFALDAASAGVGVGVGVGAGVGVGVGVGGADALLLATAGADSLLKLWLVEIDEVSHTTYL